ANALSVGEHLHPDRASRLEADPVDANPQRGVRFFPVQGDSELRPATLRPDADDIWVCPAVTEAREVIDVRKLDPPIRRKVEAAGPRSPACAPVELATHQVA